MPLCRLPLARGTFGPKKQCPGASRPLVIAPVVDAPNGPEGAAVGPDGVLHGQEPEVVEPGLAQEVGERPPVVLRRSPDEPTAEERITHNILHEPYRSWCRSCVAGRGRADRHTLRAPEEKGRPIVGVDYGYLHDRSEEDAEMEQEEHPDPTPSDTTPNPILAGRNSRDRWVFGHLLPQKGNVAWNREILAKELLDGGYKHDCWASWASACCGG